MKDYVFIKGIIVGIAKIIPGLSGAVLMISFQLYDKAIHAITHFFSDVRNNFLFLLELGCGILVGIVLFSKVVSFLLMRYYLYTTVFFIGLIIGGLPILIKEISHSRKNIVMMLIAFLFVTIFTVGNVHGEYVLRHNIVDYFVFAFSGLLEAVGTVLPGVSSTVLLMLVGMYSHYITTISHLFTYSLLQENLMFLVPFSFGLIIGVIVISLLVDYLFQYYKEVTFSVILGFSLSSVFLLILKILPYCHHIMDMIICLIVGVIGYFIANYF